MKTISNEAAASPTAMDKLREIQAEMQEICKPHYHEFYSVTTERGFTKITIPKKK